MGKTLRQLNNEQRRKVEKVIQDRFLEYLLESGKFMGIHSANQTAYHNNETNADQSINLGSRYDPSKKLKFEDPDEDLNQVFTFDTDEKFQECDTNQLKGREANFKEGTKYMEILEISNEYPNTKAKDNTNTAMDLCDEHYNEEVRSLNRHQSGRFSE